MAGKGEFFAIGRKQWSQACSLGIGPATVFLVLARGTGRDNSTTAWSAEACHKYAGISWRRATSFIDSLVRARLVTKTKAGKRPSYKLDIPESKEDLIWLPNTLVDGAGNEIPPVARLRQGQDVEFLQAFVELYGAQDLEGDGGLPRSLVHGSFKPAVHICDLAQYKVKGFSSEGRRHCWFNGPLQRFRGKQGPGGEERVWLFLDALTELGLVETADYLAEGDSPDAELICAFSGDEHALGLKAVAAEFAAELPAGFKYASESYDYTLAVPNHLHGAAMVKVSRLVYRPHTTKTAAWYRQHVDACRAFTAQYTALAARDFRKVA